MLLQSDFWRAAKYLISRYGPEACERANLRAKELRDADETSLHKIWLVLATTVAELSAREAPQREPAESIRRAERRRPDCSS